MVLSTWGLLLLLGQNPGLEALEVDETDGTSALACDNEGVSLIVLVSPADSALNLVLRSIINILGALHLHCFSQLLVIKLLFGHVDVVAPEILDTESDSSELDGVELLDLVVILAVFVLQRSGHKPKPVNRFFFLSLGANGVIKIISL